MHPVHSADKKYNVVSLFSGAGGFDWGFHRTGRYETQLACELLIGPAATLSHNLGLRILPVQEQAALNGAPTLLHGDIRHIDFSTVEYQPDVLIGGPPCQDFSITISKSGEDRPGLDGGRGQLYAEFVRAVMFLQPKFFVFENVEGLLSANSGGAFKTILSDLRHLENKRKEAALLGDNVPDHPICSYQILFSDVVNGPSLGIPQTRRRLIIIGMREDLSRHILETGFLGSRFEYALSGQDSLFVKYPLVAMEIFEGKSIDLLQDKYVQVIQAYEEVAEQPFAHLWRETVWDKLKWDVVQDYLEANGLSYQTFDESEFQEAMTQHRRLLEEVGWWDNPLTPERHFSDNSNKHPRLTDIVAQRMSMIPPGENHEFVANTPWKVEGKDISFIYRRAHPLRPAWTVMAYGGGGTYGYHYERNRAQLTLRERARIQSFTDDFEFRAPHARAQIGEAVPPLLGKRIAELIAEVLDDMDAA